MVSQIRIDKVAWICIRNKKVLCVRSKGKEQFFMPSGKREGNETDVQTLARELREELCITLNTDSVCYYGTFEAPAASDQMAGTMLRETCYMATYKGLLYPQSEIAEIAWLGYEDKNTLTPLGIILREDLHVKGFI